MTVPVTDCTRCPALVRGRSRIVNGEGLEDADILFVGEGPGQVEDERGRPFVGKSGRVLKVIEWAAGIDPSRIYHTNATRCWGGRNPTGKEVDACHDYLMEEIRQVNPKVIVTLGGPALRSLYHPGPIVSDVMGFTIYNDELPSIPIIPTFHPAYLMRKHWGEVALVLAHFRKALRIADTQDWKEELGSYMGITSLGELRDLRDYLLGPDVRVISVDTETTGLRWMDDELLCVSFSGEAGLGYSVPLLHRGVRTKMEMKGRGKNRKEVPVEEFVPVPFWPDDQMDEVLAIIEEVLSSDKPKAGQNIEFDLRMLERTPDEPACRAATAFGFHVNNVEYDTRLMSSLLFESLPANLAVLNAYWTDMPYYEQGIAPYKKRMWHLPDDVLWEYGGADVDVVQQLAPPLYAQMQAEQVDWVYNNISLPLIHCANRLTERGVAIDLDYFDRLCGYFKEKLEEEQQTLDDVVGHHVKSPTHYQHAQELLFKELKLPLTRWCVKSALTGCKSCKKDAPCSPQHAATSGEALQELYQREPHPALPPLIQVKQSQKFYSTYLEGGESGGFRAHIREDGRIHGRWNAGRAETGRFTCEEPNLMNPPKEVKIDSDKWDIHSEDAIRSMFTAAPGNLVMNADWSQLEVWVLAYKTGDSTLLGLLMDGKDVHVYVARKLCELGVSRVFSHDAWEPELSDEEWKAKYPALRGKAKTFTFGLSYQLTEMGAADRLQCSLEEAHDLFVAFLNQVFPTLPDYFARCQEEILSTYGIRNEFDRRRHFPEVPILGVLRYRTDLEGVIRQGVNFPIQSGGHDLHSLAHIHTEAYLLDSALPVLEMHDSLMMESSEGGIEDAAWTVKREWENLARTVELPNGEALGWEIPVEIRWGRSFGAPKYVLTAAGEIEKIGVGA